MLPIDRNGWKYCHQSFLCYLWVDSYMTPIILATLWWPSNGPIWPTRPVLKICSKNLWLFSKLVGNLQILGRGPCPCIFLPEQICHWPWAFQLWALLLKPQLWSHSHPISVEKETGWGLWTFILQDSDRGSCHLLAPHPHKFNHIFLLAFLCVF